MCTIDGIRKYKVCTIDGIRKYKVCTVDGIRKYKVCTITGIQKYKVCTIPGIRKYNVCTIDGIRKYKVCTIPEIRKYKERTIFVCTKYVLILSAYFPCGMGVRIQPKPALRRVVRGDYLRDMSYPLPRPIACRVFLHAMGRMSWDSFALGCPGSGNILFLRRMSSYL